MLIERTVLSVFGKKIFMKMNVSYDHGTQSSFTSSTKIKFTSSTKIKFISIDHIFIAQTVLLKILKQKIIFANNLAQENLLKHF